MFLLDEPMAILMFFFGLGTLPTLLAMGAFAAGLAAFARRPLTRRLAGGAVALFGVYYLVAALRFFVGGQ